MASTAPINRLGMGRERRPTASERVAAGPAGTDREPAHEDRRHDRAGVRAPRRHGAHAARRRRRRAGSTSATARSTSTSPAWRRCARWRPSVGRPIGVLADLPGPEDPRRAVPRRRRRPGRRRASCALVPGPSGRAPRTVVTVDYPTLLDDLDPGDRVVIGDGAITLRRGADDVDEVCRRGRDRRRARRVAPACTCRAERVATSRPTAEDLVLADAIAAAGVDYIAVSFVAPRRRRRRAARDVVGDRARHRRQDRDRRGARASSARSSTRPTR